ncbi:MAG: DNA methyltransferase, partial [Candidatus Thorarchaeota archaeon]
MNYKIGDCREVLKEYPDDSFDSCVTDPPYGLEFMGKEWDNISQMPERDRDYGTKFPNWHGSGIQFSDGKAQQDWHLLWLTEVFRVLKPGAFLLSFGGTRTYHRMACAVEDAGFEIRDMIPWIYGSGFPKSLDISKSIDRMNGAEREVVGVGHCGYRRMGRTDEDVFSSGIPKEQSTVPITAPSTPDAITWNGWGTALKPAIEPIVVARKPLSERNVALNVLKYGTGGINVDASRVGVGNQWWDDPNEPDDLAKQIMQGTQGRFPANLILECICEEVVPGKIVGNGHVPKLGKAASQSIYGDYNYVEKDERYLKEQSIIHTNPNCPCYLLDEQSGELKSGSLLQSHQPQIKQKGIYGELGTDRISRDYLQDNGGASRFFYVAKASRKERYFHCSVCQKAYPGDQRDNHRKHMMHCDDCGCDYEPQFKELDFVNRNTLNMSPEGGRKYFYADDHKEHASRSNLL